MSISGETANLTILLLGWNLFIFFLYGLDKVLAKMGRRRISEAVLLCSSLCMGSVGAVLGMIVWNHKTKKLKFRILVPSFLLLQTILLAIFGEQLFLE